MKFSYQCNCGYFFDVCLDEDTPEESSAWCPHCYNDYQITLKIQPLNIVKKAEKKSLDVPDLIHIKSLVRHSIGLIEEKIRERLKDGGALELLFIPHDFKDIIYENKLVKKLNFKIREIRKSYNKKS